ncbi:hypothetical protein [Patulibacter sp.]|uniref:hypothetical protein n=1 Tax=Patulibacter sp. TaxID=1912859 RepID=UPI0027247900|nr:hypothetical protein [Patulibacter sp.]MDO9410694.1 hypothetical protein [Patulibacter sp.]
MPDARFVGRPHVDDDHRVVPDRVIDPTGGAGDGGQDTGGPAGTRDGDRTGRVTDVGAPSAGSRASTPSLGATQPAVDRTDGPAGTTAGRSGAPTGPTTGRPGVGTRLRRLARAITPTKDDHHG